MRSSPGVESFPGFTLIRARGVLLFVSVRYASSAITQDLLNLPRVLSRLQGQSSRLAGRNTLWEWHPDALEGDPLVVRQFVHGGLWGRVARDLFLGSGRMRRELRVCLHARSRGVPTCEPLALRIERAGGLFRRGYLVTRRVPDAVNVLALCRRIRDGSGPSPAHRRVLTKRLAQAIATMHDAGIVHGDLNVKNLLVGGAADDPRVFIIDFDKARMCETVPLRDRLKNLVRLDRSVLKWPETRELVTLTDRLRLWRDYLRLYPRWADRWKELAEACRTQHLLHRLSRKR